MTSRRTLLGRWSLAVAVGAAALLLDVRPMTKSGSHFTGAQAVVGRPATPLSYSGVARRTTRRADTAGASAGRTCTRVADGYGRVMTRCY
jgi:hypothetical protein